MSEDKIKCENCKVNNSVMYIQDQEYTYHYFCNKCQTPKYCNCIQIIGFDGRGEITKAIAEEHRYKCTYINECKGKVINAIYYNYHKNEYLKNTLYICNTCNIDYIKTKMEWENKERKRLAQEKRQKIKEKAKQHFYSIAFIDSKLECGKIHQTLAKLITNTNEVSFNNEKLAYIKVFNSVFDRTYTNKYRIIKFI